MATLGGLANGGVNFLVLLLSLKMDASVMFPIISAGGILCATTLSVTVYKEKLSIVQKIGVALGVLAIVVLNI
jgi:multidrug transporter EmrE-like cation transporter